jgi:hypothetical protein
LVKASIVLNPHYNVLKLDKKMIEQNGIAEPAAVGYVAGFVEG